MSLLDKLVRTSPEDATVPLSSANILSWLTGGSADDTAGVAISERRVLGLPAYFRAVAVTAGTLAQLPVHVYAKRDDGKRELVGRPTVLDAPNPRQTPFEFKFTMYANGITWGDMFAEKVRDGLGEVRQVWPVHPSRVRVEAVKPTAGNPQGKLFHVTGANDGRPYTSDQMMHIPYLSPDGIQGVRPLEIFRQSLGIAVAGDTAAASLFKNGSRLQGVLSSDQKLDDTTAQRIKNRWIETNTGPRNAGNVAVLGSGAKFQPIALPPGDLQLLESRQWSVAEIARMVGTPPHLIGDVSRSTSWGTGIEEQVLGWVKFTLGAWITSAEQRVTLEVLHSDEYAKMALEGLLRGDSKARAAFYHSAITDGWLNRNEVRELEDREAVEGLDEFIVPSNMSIIAVDGKFGPASDSGNDQGNDTNAGSTGEAE